MMVGGMTAVAVRRAARLGDGWLPLMFIDRWEGDQLAAMSHLMRSESEASGRDTKLRWTLKLHCPPDHVDQIPARLEEIARLGFDEVIIEAPFASGIDAASTVIADTVAAWS